jgi:chorismate dehydratase
MIRIGAVGFLNARPLLVGLDAEPWCSLRVDLPSVCARLLHEGEIDLGLVPTIELLRGPGPYAIVPGPAIGCRGAVASVALFTRVPIQAIRTIALDTSSRASVALLRVLCARHFGITPRFVDAPPDLPTMLAGADAGLLIGDPALDAAWQPLGAEKIDLGEAWWAMTGLPFVFAVWAARPGVITVAQALRLRAARDQGLTRIDEIAAAHAGGDARRHAAAAAYLRDRIRYDLDEEAVRGLTRYLDLATELGLAPARPWHLRWVGSLAGEPVHDMPQRA